MKIRLLSLLLALLMLVSCGTETSSVVSEASQEEPPQTFGQIASDTPVQVAETTAMPSVSEEEPEEVPGEAPLAPEEADDGSVEWAPLHAQLTALILMKESDGLDYQAEDPVAMLRSLGYLAGLMQDHDSRIEVSGSTGTITAAMAEEYVKALFHNFSGQFPAVTEEDPLVKQNGKNYEINLVDLGDLSLECGPIIEEADGTMTLTATLTLDGRPLPSYRFTIETAASQTFHYGICSMTRSPGA